MVGKDFLTAGKAVFTVSVPEQYWHLGAAHYTFRICHKPATAQYAECYFVSILTGPDNTSDYTYCGKLGPNGEVWRTAKSALPESSWPWKLLTRTLYRIFAGEADAIEAAGFRVQHEGKCGRCGRPLTEPESIECGLGPVCRGK